MLHKYSKTEIAIGLPISVLLLLLFTFSSYYFLTNEIEEKQPHQRLAFIYFSLMMAVMGLSGLLRFIAIKLPILNSASALLWSFAIIMFGFSFILVGIFEKDSIVGGIPLIPAYFNRWVGAVFFICIGTILILLTPKLYRYKRDNG